jgi:hypothetical protein
MSDVLDGISEVRNLLESFSKEGSIIIKLMEK